MKTKMLSLILAAVITLFATACGSTSTETVEPTDNTTDNATNSTTDTETAEDAVEVDALEFECNATFYETDTAGVVMQYFCDTLEEMSGGSIVCTMSWGATLYDDTSAFDAVRNGAIEMIVMKESPILSYLPLLGVPSCAPTSDGYGALEYLRTIFFEDEETSALIEDMCTAQGIKLLNVLTTGENVFAASFPWSTLDELVDGSAAFGAKATAKYEALGLSCAPYGGNEVYDAVSRGIIDAANYTLYGAYSMSWYEVAPYAVRDTLWAVGNSLTVNDDWWNGLTDEQREIIQAAADAASDYSAEYVTGLMDEVATSYSEAAGVEVQTLSEEDSQRWWSATFNATANDSMNRVAGGEYEQGMITILEKAAEITDIDWSYSE